MKKILSGALAALLVAGSFALAAPAYADEAVAPPVVETVEAAEPAPVEAVVEAVEIEQAPPAPVIEPAPAVEGPAPAEPVVEEAPADLAPMAAKGSAPPVAANNGYDSTLNDPATWENTEHESDCFKHEASATGGSQSDHGTSMGNTVTLAAFNQSWPGDHWERLVIKAGTENAVYEHPTAGTAYAAPDGKDVSHWIVCKGETPAPVVVPNSLTTSHTVECGVVTITLRNVSPWIYPTSVEIDGVHSYGPTVDNRTGGTLSGPQKDQSVTRTITFPEDSGEHTVRYRVQAGSEDALYKGLPVGEWTEITVQTDCEPNYLPTCITVTGAQTIVGDGVLTVEGDWATDHIDVPFSGTLADIGTVLDIDAEPIGFVGLHIDTAEGTIVFEEEATYGGNLWSTSAWAGVEAGMGYAAFGSISEFIDLNGDVAVSGIRLLYTHPEASSTTVTSFTIGCTLYTFEPPVVVPEEPVPVVEVVVEETTDCDAKTVTTTTTTTTTGWVYEQESNEWVAGEPVVTVDTETRDATEEECPTPVVPEEPEEPVVPAKPVATTGGNLPFTGGEFPWAGLIAGLMALLAGGGMFAYARRNA